MAVPMDKTPGAGEPRAEQDDHASMQIGDVAERTGLSLRTIRYYEEAELVAPSTRTPGGFRLYTEADCDRLELVRQMKPLGFSLDEVRDLLDILDRLDSVGPDTDAATADVLGERLERFARAAQERCDRLSEQLAEATSVTGMLRHRLGDVGSEGATR